jgi:phosphopantothenoylcysteine decarboxylase/phosphopantothenate--cysteine ligase
MTNIVLAAGASAALHKSCDLASKLAQEGHAVRAVLTRRAASLVSPQLFEALTGEAAWVDEFDAERRGGMDHITLAEWASLFVVAPCPADLLSRLALGLADDLVTTVALALAPEVPRLVCPAMNPNMWAAPAVVRNRELLRSDGWKLLEPGAGHMACGVQGQGRMMEPLDIVVAIGELAG